jgi:serine/threonine-protein kinase HipA
MYDEADTLVVLLHRERAGEVTQVKGELRFRYDEAWRESVDATPLSLSMPLAVQEHGDEVVRAFLWGLLPDNERVLERWARSYQVSARNPFAILRHVGEDCAGAAQFVVPDSVDRLMAGEGGVDWIDDDEIASRLKALRGDPTAWHAARATGQFSLAGARAKTALQFDPVEERWGDPWGAAATTHIFKPAVAGLDDHDLNEHLCLQAARALGLPAAASQVMSFSGERAIVVERYDRIRGDDGSLRRVHQEDACQALGTSPDRKYESDGGPRVDDIVNLLRNSVSPSRVMVESIRRFVDAVALNWLLAGTDAHAKNYSVLLAGRLVRLAPLYDIGSALPYDDMHLPKLRMAMRVGHEYRISRLQRRHWLRLADDCLLDGDEVVSRVDELAARLPDALSEVCADPTIRAMNSSLPGRLCERVAEHAARSRESLRVPDS